MLQRARSYTLSMVASLRHLMSWCAIVHLETSVRYLLFFSFLNLLGLCIFWLFSFIAMEINTFLISDRLVAFYCLFTPVSFLINICNECPWLTGLRFAFHITKQKQNVLVAFSLECSGQDNIMSKRLSWTHSLV